MYEVTNPEMAEVVYSITDMILSEEFDIDEVLHQAIDEFADQFSEQSIRETYQQVLDNMPELN